MAFLNTGVELSVTRYLPDNQVFSDDATISVDNTEIIKDNGVVDTNIQTISK